MKTTEEIRDEVTRRYKTRMGHKIEDWEDLMSLYAEGSISDWAFDDIVNVSMEEYASQFKNFML